MRTAITFISASLAVTAMLSCLLLATPSASLGAVAIESPKNCNVCGMYRTVYAQSRMLMTHADGSAVGVCSIHCAAAESLMSTHAAVTSLLVADYATLALLDAKSAVWVVGGDATGVMTRTAKWAFATDEAAQEFIAAHGGKIAPFDQAMKLAEAEVADGGKLKQGDAPHAGPLYQDLHGLQMKASWFMAAGLQIMI